MNLESYKIPDHFQKITSIDAHTEGEPLRIILSGLPKLEGNTVLEKRSFFKKNYDHLRTALIWEPRGHADQYGAVLVDPERKDSDFGVFFIHNDGYSAMCGHAIIALTKVLLETGILPKKEWIKIDSPAGLVHARANYKEGKIESCSFQNVPSFVYRKDVKIQVEDFKDVSIDIAYGGAFYAYLNAADVGLDLGMDQHDRIIEFGKLIKKIVKDQIEIEHPAEKDLSFLYGVIFVGPPKDQSNHSRNVCIFANGELDRSPTGTGVSGRAALHFSKQELEIGDKISIESILGSLMEVCIIEKTNFFTYEAVIPEVTGRAYITGQNNFYIDPLDPFKEGFLFR